MDYMPCKGKAERAAKLADVFRESGDLESTSRVYTINQREILHLIAELRSPTSRAPKDQI
jgi:hypothetical protein